MFPLHSYNNDESFFPKTLSSHSEDKNSDDFKIKLKKPPQDSYKSSMISAIMHRREKMKMKEVKEDEEKEVKTQPQITIEEIWLEGEKCFKEEKNHFEKVNRIMQREFPELDYENYLFILQSKDEKRKEVSDRTLSFKLAYGILKEPFKYAFRSKDCIAILLRKKAGEYYLMRFELRRENEIKESEIKMEDIYFQEMKSAIKSWKMIALEEMNELNEIKKICLRSEKNETKEKNINNYLESLPIYSTREIIWEPSCDTRIFKQFYLKDFQKISLEIFNENIIQNLFACHLQAFLPNDIPFMSEVNLEILSHGHFIMNSYLHTEYLRLREKAIQDAAKYFEEKSDERRNE